MLTAATPGAQHHLQLGPARLAARVRWRRAADLQAPVARRGQRGLPVRGGGGRQQPARGGGAPRGHGLQLQRDGRQQAGGQRLHRARRGGQDCQ